MWVSEIKSLTRSGSSQHFEMTSSVAQLVRAHLPTLSNALASLVRERSLNQVVAGVTISLAIPFIATIYGFDSLKINRRRVLLNLLESRLSLLSIIGFPGVTLLHLLLGLAAALLSMGVVGLMRLLTLRSYAVVPRVRILIPS